MSDIRPFTLEVPQAELDRLLHKLDDTRWPEPETVDNWTQGTPLAELKMLLDYWRDGYDWRACEAQLKQFGQYVTEIDGLDIHFLHIRSSHQDALPMVLTHGWPGSVREFFDVIPLLTEPEGDAQAFHLVIPSLPGFGYSGKPAVVGWGIEKIAASWAALMQRLGYSQWIAQGGDWGSMVTTMIGAQAPAGCMGIHVNMPVGQPLAEDMANPAHDEIKALKALQFYRDHDSGYSKQQSTRPQTVGYGLVDSPAGLAGWILEKMYAWTDNEGSPYDALSMDAILDNIMLYWLPATGASAARLYWESFANVSDGKVQIPTGVTAYPKEIIPAARKWAERRYTDIVHWHNASKGGHFAAWEQPELFAEELGHFVSALDLSR